MANGAFKFKDNSGNVVSFISGSGSNISFSGGTLDLSGMTGLTLGNLTLSGTTQNALSASHAASYLLTSSFNTYSGTTDTVIGTLQTSTSSLNSFTSSATTRLNSIEGVSGSYATTGSNLFKGSQTISGSVIPAVTNTYDLGSPTNNFRHLYLSSASLYIDGTKVLGSTAQELQITTDTGQSFKILEAGSDNITLQSADGNIELKSSGGGDVILDPTTGVIALKGTTTLYAGNKLLSSDGNAIQVGNSLTVTGSMIVTGYIETQELRTTYISSSILYRSGSTKFGDELTDTHSFTGSLSVSGSISVPGSGLISGSSQVLNGSGVFSGSAQLPSGIVSSSAQTIANLPSGTVSGSAQILNGTGFVKTTGASITYDNSTYLTTASATSTYLPLAGGIMSDNISYGVGNGVAWYLQPQAVGGGPSNGPVLRLKSHSAAGALSDRSGALAWIDGNNSRLDLFEWNSSLINAYVPINGTSAVFSSSVTATSLTISGTSNAIVTINSTYVNGGFLQMQKSGTNYGYVGCSASLLSGTTNDFAIISPSGTLELGGGNARGLIFSTSNAATFSSTLNVNSTATIAYNGLSGDFGTGYTTGLGVGYSSSVAKGINMGWNTTLDMGFIGTIHNGTGWKSLILCPIGGAVYIGATGNNNLYAGSVTLSAALSGTSATFSNTLTSSGLITGQASIHQSDAGGIIASNRFSVYNGGAATMRFLYNASGDVIFDNGTPRLTLSSGGTALFNVNASSSITLTAGGTDASMLKAGPGDELYIGGNDTWQMRLSGGNILMDNGGNVGINTGSPSARLDINGDVRYRGGIYDQFSFAATGNYTNGTYYNIIGVNAIATGIYILQGEIDTYAVGGGIYFMRFVSVPFYMWDVGSNSVTFVDLPPVLGTGHHLGNAFPLFRLQMTGGGTGIFLQFNPNVTWAGLDNVSGGKSFRVNLKRIG